MNMLTDGAIMQLLDGISCALLASAAASRARNLGAHITGAVVLGCLAGLMGPLLREVFLHGSMGTAFIMRQFPAEALVGSLGAIAALSLASSRAYAIFFWLDALSMGLASSLGTLLSMPELGLIGALTLGLVNGLAPGLIRDVALGDTALLIDQDWYATAAALGSVACMGMIVFIHLLGTPAWIAEHSELLSVFTGILVCCAIRYWRFSHPMT